MAGLQSFSGLDWSNGERCYLQDYAKKAKKQFLFGMVTKPVTIPIYDRLNLILVDPRNADEKNLKMSVVNFQMVKKSYAAIIETSL